MIKKNYCIVFISKKKNYIKKHLEKFEMNNAKPISTLFATHFKYLQIVTSMK